MRKIILSVFLFGIIAISGCIETSPKGINSLANILENPDDYVDKNITIVGIYSETLGGDEFLIDEQGYKIRIDCKEEDRVFNLGNTYKAKGIMTFYEICGCQSRFYINLTQEEFDELVELNITNYYGESITKLENLKPEQNEGWSDAFAFEHKVEKGYCTELTYIGGTEIIGYVAINQTHRRGVISLKIFEYRCKPNSIEKSYYLKCTEPIIKIS